jgi:hypothetical protein
MEAYTMKAIQLTLIGKSPSIMLQCADYQSMTHHTQECYDWLYVHPVFWVQSI